MKVLMKLNENVTVEAEGETVADVFTALSRLATVFSVSQCGLCGCATVVPQVREAQGYTYYELRCGAPKCGAQFQFGQHKDVKGSLFPKRKDKDGNWMPNNGWFKWQPQQQQGHQRHPYPGQRSGNEEPLPY